MVTPHTPRDYGGAYVSKYYLKICFFVLLVSEPMFTTQVSSG